jgi:1,4-alpha-glucan branching enzyme
MAQIHEHYPEAKLLVFGDGPLEDALRDQAKDLSDGTVEICGRVSPEELYEKMATATATVFPSEWDEPFGRVTVESMALGTPVVGSRVGGIAEIIDNENTGKLFSPGDVGELASLLIELINNPDAWHQLSKAGIDRSKQFSPEPIVEEHVELYQSMASGSR